TFTFGDTPLGVITSTDPLVNPIYSYAYATPQSQTFQVICIASNNLGCVDTTMNVLKVNNPLPNFHPLNYFPCLPKFQTAAAGFTAYTGYTTYSLSFGDPPGSPT